MTAEHIGDAPHRTFEFLRFSLEEGGGELCRDGVPISLNPTPLRLLLYLLERRDRAVSKAELLDRVWSETCVSESALASALWEIRRALFDDGGSQRVILTERGRGYRFMAPVEVRGVSQRDSSTPTLAVLPFVDMSRGRDQENFADGLVEELIHLLSQSTQLRVAARTSSFAFKGRQEDVRAIGEQLDVAYVLEGSVRTCGDWLRVTAQLVRADDGFHLCSAHHDRVLAEDLALQQEIAAEIVSSVMDKLGQSGTFFP